MVANSISMDSRFALEFLFFPSVALEVEAAKTA
jgi:hypothetical protein